MKISECLRAITKKQVFAASSHHELSESEWRQIVTSLKTLVSISLKGGFIFRVIESKHKRPYDPHKGADRLEIEFLYGDSDSMITFSYTPKTKEFDVYSETFD